MYSSYVQPLQIRKVVKAYTPQVGDELELIDGDYIFLDPKELNKTKDGWYPGVSWLTGQLAMFPGVYTQKTAETWTWALHRLYYQQKFIFPQPFLLYLKKNIFEGINSSIFGKTLIPVTCFAVYFFFNLKNYCFVSKRQKKKILVEVKLLQSHWS